MLPLREMTIGQALTEAARKYGANTAIEYEKVTWSYEELDLFSDSLAKGFLAKGVKKGSHVAIWATIDPDVLLVFYALQKIGAVTVMLYTAQQPEQLEQRLRNTDCHYLVISKKVAQSADGALCSAMEEKGICRVLAVGIGKCGDFSNFGEVMSVARQISHAQLAEAKAAVQPQDPSVILFTSGTSGRIKAVVTTHYSRINSGIQQAADIGATDQDSFCVALPMFHCFCISTNIMAALAVGAKLHLMTSRRTQYILDAISRGKCTILNAVPTLYHALCSRPDLGDYDLSSLRAGFIGGGAYSPEQFREFEDTLGITLLSSLGLTEGTAGITVCNMDDPLEVRCKTVGHFMSHVEGKIIDIATGEELYAGESGEICVRGYVVMAGYYGEPELTAEAVDEEGWLHTGDMGWLDRSGNLHLCGRIKDLVIRGGENISPQEVANVILRHDKVRDVKVIGVPDAHYGEELCACVVADATVTEDSIREYAAQHLEPFKIPRYVLFFDELPYNPTGKIMVGRLKELVAQTGKIPGLGT